MNSQAFLIPKSPVRFVPSSVDGLPNVSLVTVFPDRLEVVSAGRPLTFRFIDIARFRRPAPLWRTFFHFGLRGRWSPPVGERDWFHPPAERFFRFYTTPSLIIRMPMDERRPHPESTFFAITHVLSKGGFWTFDLG